MEKNLPAIAGDLGSISGLGRSPGGGYGNPLSSIFAWRILVDTVPWGRKKLDRTEQLSIHTLFKYVFCYKNKM